jgi:deoxycytidine triphosphate deaminase
MPEAEVFELDTGGAEKLARKFRATEESPDVADDPCPHIAPSLLSADHIVEYVRETGLVAPFSSDTSKNGRLKKASYEARLGDSAYYFEVPGGKKGPTGADPKPLQTNSEGNLVLPPNSIVFVQCDLQFRLPPFIALRFNLSISHVHRGLLLGTGPLVDPGFWGNLCIPIHNLTDEEYEIEPDDGLIWIEFTKTTSSNYIGRLPSGDGSWDIKKFIEKAQKQVDPQKDRVGIRSGISKALADAEKAGKLVSTAQEAATSARDWVRGIGFGAGIAAAIGIGGIFYGGISVVSSYHKDVRNLEAELEKNIKLLDGNAAEVTQATVSSLSEDIESLSTNVANLTTELEAERSNTQQLEEIIEALVQSDRSNTSRFESLLNHCASDADDEKPEFCAIISD